MYQMLKARSEALKDEAVSFAMELVRTPSVSLNEADAAVRVERRMKNLSFDRVIHDEAGNVVGLLLGRKPGPTVLLNCHLDTVAADEAQWSEPALSGRLEDGKLHGLGASDCKGGLAAQVYAAELLKRSLLPLDGNVVVATTVAEENGRSVGVRALMETTLPELGLKPDFAILGEPTGLSLYYGHDGWVELDVIVEGANPFQVEDSARAVHGFFDERCRQKCQFERPGVAATRAPRMEDADGLRRATIPIDRWLYATESVQEVISQVRENAELVAKSVGAVAVDVSVPEDRQRLYTGRTSVVRRVANAWAIDPFDPLLERSRQTLAAAGCPARASLWKLDRLGMGTAGGVLVKEFGVPTVGFGPGEETRAHAPDEWVSVDKIAGAVYATAAVVHGLVGIPVFGWTTDEI